jgi:cell division protein FtsL
LTRAAATAARARPERTAVTDGAGTDAAASWRNGAATGRPGPRRASKRAGIRRTSGRAGTRRASGRAGIRPASGRARIGRRTHTATGRARWIALPIRVLNAPFARTLRMRTAGVLDALLAGRGWIALIGVLLAGIVFFNVDLLQMNRDIARDAERASALKRENARLRLEVARLASSERIQEAAAGLGLVLPAPGEVRYLKARPGRDARRAAKRITEPDGTLAPPPAPASDSAAPPATTTTPAAPAAPTPPLAAPPTTTPPTTAPPATAPPTTAPAPLGTTPPSGATTTTTPPAGTVPPATTTPTVPQAIAPPGAGGQPAPTTTGQTAPAATGPAG